MKVVGWPSCGLHPLLETVGCRGFIGGLCCLLGGGAHARHEHVSVSGMVERAAVAAAVIGVFARETRTG